MRCGGGGGGGGDVRGVVLMGSQSSITISFSSLQLKKKNLISPTKLLNCDAWVNTNSNTHNNPSFNVCRNNIDKRQIYGEKTKQNNNVYHIEHHHKVVKLIYSSHHHPIIIITVRSLLCTLNYVLPYILWLWTPTCVCCGLLRCDDDDHELCAELSWAKRL